MNNVRLIALDMDGTITQHKTPLGERNKRVLDQLKQRYRLVMVGAGSYKRIHNQMEGYPIDVIGSYGMQISLYNKEKKDLELIEEVKEPVKDRQMMLSRAQTIREKFGYEKYIGESVEFHDSGMMTFALLGTQANIEDKLAFDPFRIKRWPMYQDVSQAFSEYTVFLGGSSSFDIVPKPYQKYHALQIYCKKIGIDPRAVVYFGDDFGTGGNDEQIFNSDIRFVTMRSYEDFEHMTQFLLL